MFHLFVVLTLSLVPQAEPAEARKVAASVGTAYEANRAALSGHGAIRFHCCDGDLVGPSKPDAAANAIRGDWKRRSPSQGLYVFDGPNRRYENLYSAEQLLDRRVQNSPNSWVSRIGGRRLLTDGETTLVDAVRIGPDGQTLLHNAACRAGVAHFFQFAGNIPLGLGNSEPADSDLGRCLRGVTDGTGKAALVSVDEAARLNGVAVVKLVIDDPVGRKHWTFWVDLEHGAIPLQCQVLAFIPHAKLTQCDQYNYDDIRWVGKGWLPFRYSYATGPLSADGASIDNLFVREVVVEHADFERPPDRAMFRLEFPEEYGITDSDRRLQYGKRRVWDASYFSRAARARAPSLGPVSLGPSPPVSEARGAPRGWPIVLVVTGAALLAAAGTIVFKRRRAVV
jgi:hypothetical protein